MKRLRNSYCSYCSTEKEDERELEFKDNIITCLHCKKRSILVPEEERSPFHYIEEMEEEEYG